MSAFEMLAFFRFIKFYNEGEITMVSVRKRGKVYAELRRLSDSLCEEYQTHLDTSVQKN